MLIYDDGQSENFVFVYDRQRVIAESEPVDIGAIIRETGFRPDPTGSLLKILYERGRTRAEFGPPYDDWLMWTALREPKPGDWSGDLDLREFAKTERFFNPQYLTCLEAAKPTPEEGDSEPAESREVGMGVECKLVRELDNKFIELQLSMGKNSTDSPFESPDYSVWLRERLIKCIEALVGLPGFEFGFRLDQWKDNSGEGFYRLYFSECIEGGRFSLGRLVRHPHLGIYGVAAGGSVLQHYGREVFDTCPAWRVSHPSEDTVCVFFDNLIPYGEPGYENRTHEALPHLTYRLFD